MFGVLQLIFGGIEVESVNDGCNGHIPSIWRKRNWFVTLSCVRLRTL
jgi:hypothetical protein